MATDKQIAANHTNGANGKTAAGRLKSSRNPYRHGLSLPCCWTSRPRPRPTPSRALADDHADKEKLAAAAEVARAQLRIRAARAELMAGVSLEWGNQNDLKRLAALDRYERLAAMRRASHKLWVQGPKG